MSEVKRGEHVYSIEVQVAQAGDFVPTTGRVILWRDDDSIAEWPFDSAAERDAAICSAREDIPPEEHDPLAWGIGIGDDHSDLWPRGWAIWQIGICPDGEGTAATSSSEVLARSESEALSMAMRDLRERDCIDGDAALLARIDRPRANPSPIDEGKLANYWTYGPEGWAKYDLRAWYSGIVAKSWWTGTAFVDRPYDGPIGRAVA